jgi:hypothetical protein
VTGPRPEQDPYLADLLRTQARLLEDYHLGRRDIKDVRGMLQAIDRMLEREGKTEYMFVKPEPKKKVAMPKPVDTRMAADALRVDVAKPQKPPDYAWRYGGTP